MKNAARARRRRIGDARCLGLSPGPQGAPPTSPSTVTILFSAVSCAGPGPQLTEPEPSFHPQLTEPDGPRAQREHRRDSAGPRAPRFACALLTLPGAAFDEGTGTGPPSTSTAAPCVQMNRADGVEARRWRLGRLRSGLGCETAGRLGSRRREKGTREAHQARVARSYVCARASTGAHQPLRHQPRASRAHRHAPGTQSR